MEKRTCVLVGYGNQGKEHAAHIRNSPHFKLVGVVDPYLDTLSDTTVYKDVSELSSEKVSAAILATPPASYTSIAPILFKKGIHVLMEKPVGTRLSETIELMKQATRHNCVLMPAVQRRYQHTYQMLPNFIPLVGTLLESVITLSITHKPKEWRADDSKPGAGVLFDLGFHAIDIAIALLGDLSLIQAIFLDKDRRIYHGNNDYRAEIMLETEHKQPVRIIIERAASEKKEEVYLRGTKGILLCTRSKIVFRSENKPDKVLLETSREWDEAMEKQYHHFFNHIEQFHSASETTIQNSVDIYEGAQAMKLIDLAYAYGK